MTDESRYVRITADHCQMESPWWAAARDLVMVPPLARKLVAPDSPGTFIVTLSEADKFLDWAASVPGWEEGLFSFEPVSLEEVMRALGAARMKPQSRLN